MDKYLHANIVLSKFSRDFIQLKNDLPIRPSEMSVVSVIVKKQDKLTPLAIADILGVSKTMVATHISALEKQGYITKEGSQVDKRSFFVLPTQKAKKLVEQTEQKTYKQLKYLEQTMGGEMFDALVTLTDWAQKTIQKMQD